MRVYLIKKNKIKIYLSIFCFFCLKLIEENINSKIENLERKAAENEIVLKQLEKNYKLLLSKERVKERLKDKSIKGSKINQIQKNTEIKFLNESIFLPVTYNSQCEWLKQLNSNDVNIQVI